MTQKLPTCVRCGHQIEPGESMICPHWDPAEFAKMKRYETPGAGVAFWAMWIIFNALMVVLTLRALG